ncbi:MAG: long-chain fatty acid--CoA ligase [Gemmatimonadetes bacterium]|nr:long-chain fatty acid--CoA ligase [Gemmatimonadota bacterium]NNL31131.1 long-chain fatty acid--CoA ligase [Gemmatimonadota bacterium]
MTTLHYVADDTPVPESTLTDLFFEAVDRFGGAPAFQRLESESSVVDISYDEALERVRRVSAGLVSRGIERGDRVAILSENRPEWALADYGCLCSGVIVVPIYPTLTASQLAYILGDSEARLVFVSSQEQAEKVIEAAADLPTTPQVVTFDSTTVLDTVPWSLFLDVEPEIDAVAFRADALGAQPHDVATVLYTSGTTGQPKGVMLTHNNVASNVRASCMILPIGNADNTFSFLPLSHILQRMVDYLFFWTGCTIGYPRSLETLIVDLKKLEPTVVVSVPRIYEKIYNGVMAAEGLKKRLIEWAAGVADRVADLRLDGKEASGLLALKYSVADKLVFSKVKTAVGGRLRFFVSGGGPLAPSLNRFFYSIGLTILEGYGLTETSPVTNVNTVENFRIGSVGKPIPSTEVKIAEDGEILIRGPQVMKGYYKKPELTAEVIDAEGWFATGDIGEIDADGFLSITDRKKDIIVTAGGKNVAPQPVENLLATHGLVEQVVMVGDRRKHPSILVVPAFGPLESWARGEGISWSSRGELLADPAVVDHMESQLFGMLGAFASYEQPKKLALLDEEFTVENGMLTPTLKVKRRVVQEKLDAVIDRLYSEEAADCDV